MVCINMGMVNDLRRWMRLVENQKSPAELFIQEAKAALVSFGDRVQIDMAPAEAPSNVWIETFAATPMRAGWGSKALTVICDLASTRHITLSLEVKQDDDWDDDDGDENENDANKPPSADQLVDLYSRFGFEISDKPSRYDRTEMSRNP